MKTRIIDDEIKLVAYYPNYATALEWYQDLELCKQVDNRDTAYDINLLKGMYKYLNNHGDLFYIKYKNRLCGDVCLQPNGEVNTHPKIFLFLNMLLRTAVCEYGQFCHAAKELSRIAKCVTAFE